MTQDSELFKEASLEGASHGILPKGTLLRITGEQEGTFYPVDVELEQGNIEGWVQQDRLLIEKKAAPPKSAERKTVQNDSSSASPPPSPRKKARLRVPSDESLLLHRKTSFFFGVHGGGLFGITHGYDGPSGYLFTGLSFSGGVHGGFYLRRDVPIRFELAYTNLTGTDAGSNEAGFGFIDAGASVGYAMDEFEFYGNLHYAFAISVTSLPGTLGTRFGSVSSLGSLWIGAGAAYRFYRSALVDVSVRGAYAISFLRNPLGFQTLTVQLVLDMKG